MDSGKIKAGVIVVLLLAVLAVFDSYGFYSNNIATGAAVAGTVPADQAGDCPGSVWVSSDKQTEYGRDETVRFRIVVLNVAGFTIKRGANLVVKSAAGAVKFEKTVPAGNSEIITVEVPASQFEGGAYTAEASSGSSSCTQLRNRQPFTVTAAAKAQEEAPPTPTPPQTMPSVPTMPGLPSPPTVMEVSIRPGWNLVSINTLKNSLSTTCPKGQVDSAYAYFPEAVTQYKAEGEDSPSEEVGTYGMYRLSEDLTKLEPKDSNSANLISSYPETVSEARAVWVRNAGGSCKIVTGLMPQAGGTALTKGWNMVAVPANIKAMKLYDFLGDCKFSRGFFFSPEDQSFEQMQLRLEKYSSDSSFAQLDAGQVFEEFIGRGFWVSVKAKCKFGVAPSSAPPTSTSDRSPTVMITDLPPSSPTPGSTAVVYVTGSDDNGISVLLLYDENSNPLSAYQCLSGQKTCSHGFTATLPSTFGTPYTFKAKSIDSANQHSDFATWTVTTTAAQSDSYVYQSDEGRLEYPEAQPKQTVSCPATVSLDLGKNTYVQGETAIITATIRDKNGVVVKRGATVYLSSVTYNELVGTANFPETDSGIITIRWAVTESYLPGNYMVEVTTLESGLDDCRPVSGMAFFPVTKKAAKSNPADLAVISLGHDKITIKPGDVVNFKAAITNNGGIDTNSFKVKWWVDTTGVKTSDHPSMATGETDTNHPSVNYKWTASEGTHKIMVYVDLDDAISESNENNNGYLTEVTVEKPVFADLEALDLRPIAPNILKIIEGDKVNFKVVVENGGQMPAGPFKVKWYVDASPVKTTEHPGMDAWASDRDSINYEWNAVEGTHGILVVVDPEDVVSESDEGNNWASTEVTVEKAAASAGAASGQTDSDKPDLRANTVSILSFSTKVGDTIKFASTIENIGKAESQSFKLRWYVDGIKVKEETHPAMTVGSYDSTTLSWVPATAGKHSITVLADFDYAVKESNEDNNGAIIIVTVK